VTLYKVEHRCGGMWVLRSIHGTDASAKKERNRLIAEEAYSFGCSRNETKSSWRVMPIEMVD
jgi:hypothetical protein